MIVFALAFILTLYLLIEGKQTYRWLLAFVPQGRRGNVAQDTLVEAQRVDVRLRRRQRRDLGVRDHLRAGRPSDVLEVPAALLLALIGGSLRLRPGLGFIVSVIPAVVLALTVSPTTAVIVVSVRRLPRSSRTT